MLEQVQDSSIFYIQDLLDLLNTIYKIIFCLKGKKKCGLIFMRLHFFFPDYKTVPYNQSYGV